MTHPQIWPHISDDGSPPAKDWRPPEGEHIWYVTAWDDDELLGLWMFHPQNAVCWEVHTCLLPTAWGEQAIAAARALPEWIWKHTPCRRIVTNVPSSNRLALRFAIRAGMKIYGVNRESYLKGGKLCDQVCLGLSEGDLDVAALAPASPGERAAGPERARRSLSDCYALDHVFE
jgi:RimJ/RimL family protein N-acetyltransferase